MKFSRHKPAWNCNTGVCMMIISRNLHKICLKKCTCKSGEIKVYITDLKEDEII